MCACCGAMYGVSKSIITAQLLRFLKMSSKASINSKNSEGDYRESIYYAESLPTTHFLYSFASFLFLLFQSHAFEGVGKAGGSVTELGFERIVETLDGLCQRTGFRLVTGLLFE